MTRKSFLWIVRWWGAAVLVVGPPALAAPKTRGHRTLLVQALRERRMVTFVYQQHRRWVEPHALGRVSDNQPALLAWQTAGSSESEPPPGWRTFMLEGVRELEIGEDRFTRRPDYRREGAGLKVIDAEVAAPGNA